jgi:hypothetical protein
MTNRRKRLMEFTIEEWASKILDDDLTDCTLTENDTSFTLFYQNVTFSFNIVEYLALKTLLQLDEGIRFFYYDAIDFRQIFIFERKENGHIVDYTFVMLEDPEYPVEFDLLSIRVDGEQQDDEDELNDFFGIYGVQTLVALKNKLIGWYSEIPSRRLSFLMQAKEDEFFHYCNQHVNVFMEFRAR